MRAKCLEFSTQFYHKGNNYDGIKDKKKIQSATD